MNKFLFILALASFAIYGDAMLRLFSSGNGADWRMRMLQVSGTLSAITQLVVIWNAVALTVVLSILAALLYSAGVTMFFFARSALAGERLTLAFSKDAPRRLLNRGIYSYIRHPFYTAYGLTWMAGVVAMPSLWTGTTMLVMCLQYLWAARMEEGKFLAGTLRAEYENYRERAGMFWPLSRRR